MIVVRLMGGLGNQMFQYAFGRHLALHHKTQLFLDTSGLSSSKEKHTTQRSCDLFHFHVDAQVFKDTPVDFSYTFVDFLRFYLKKVFGVYPFFVLQERGVWDILLDKIGLYSGWFNCKKKYLSIKDNAYVIGFWQSHKYFDSIREILCKDFIPKTPCSQQNRDFITLLQTKTSVSIHIRRGDYGSTYHGHCSLEYYHAAIASMKKKFPHTTFVVFSNDIPWCKEQFGEKDFLYVDWNTGDASYWDLVLMSTCHHNIIANSSFSWRGAWLNTHPNKIVIAPKRWFLNKLDSSDLVPSDWIRM